VLERKNEREDKHTYNYINNSKKYSISPHTHYQYEIGIYT